jgi:putative membrane protein
MTPIANVLTGLVALAHVGILVLEMFLWDHPVGRRIFAMTPEVSASSRVLAMNQGLYNGFLAAGLIWGLLAGRRDVKVFFLHESRGSQTRMKARRVFELVWRKERTCRNT